MFAIVCFFHQFIAPGRTYLHCKTVVFDELFQFDFLRYQYFLVLSLLLLVSYLSKPKKILCRAVGNRFPKSRTFLINYRTVTGYWQLPNDD